MKLERVFDVIDAAKFVFPGVQNPPTSLRRTIESLVRICVLIKVNIFRFYCSFGLTEIDINQNAATTDIEYCAGMSHIVDISCVRRLNIDGNTVVHINYRKEQDIRV